MTEKRLASLTLDLDNYWTYLRTSGVSSWTTFPSFLDCAIPRIVRVFGDVGLRATIFIVGKDFEIPGHDTLINQLSAAGNELGNHSFSHPAAFHRCDADEVREELERTERHFAELGVQPPRGFRGPSFRLSETIIAALIERRYVYDSSTFPTYLGPLARAYYFARTGPDGRQSDSASDLFGNTRDGRRPLKPYRWKHQGKSLIEIPVTTLPVLRTPIHFTYINYLADISEQLAWIYLRTAMRLCRAKQLSPCLLLHATDFIGDDDINCPRFIPGMKRGAAQKIALIKKMLADIGRSFELRTLEEFVDDLKDESSLELKTFQ